MMCKLLDALFTKGTDQPSPPDIVNDVKGLFSDGIYWVNGKQWVRRKYLNIPFTVDPEFAPFGIPSKSMAGIGNIGNHFLYIRPHIDDHKFMVDWIEYQFVNSNGLKAADCVYRIMENELDDVWDFSKPSKWYAIHRLWEVSHDDNRYFRFKGVNNSKPDPYICRDSGIMMLAIGGIW